MQSRLPELRAKGLGIAAISYDPAATLAAFSKQRNIAFPLLSDAGSPTIKRYGILNPLPAESLGPNKDDPTIKADLQKFVSGGGSAPPFMVGMSFPGTFILDRKGRVTARYFEDFYVERSTTSSLMLKLGSDKAPVAATRISASHVDLTTWASDTSLAPGNHFSVVLDIKPGAGIHVYAPGATGYRAIAVNMTPQPGLRITPAKYPPSQIFFFKQLNEKVPTFQKPFRLVQDLVLEGTPEAMTALRGKDTFTLTGSLEYQACDDKECFNPVSVPLSWTFRLRQLVRERPLPNP